MATAPVPLPKLVEVGPFRYTVSDAELDRLRIQEKEQTNLSGQTDHDLLTIVLDSRLAADMLRDTLLHELLHCLAYAAGLSSEWGRDTEEPIVRRLSPLLLDLLRRNPTVVAYLVDP